MYIITKGSALELQDIMRGKRPVIINEYYTATEVVQIPVDEAGSDDGSDDDGDGYIEKEIEVVKFRPVEKKISGDAEVKFFDVLADDVFVQAMEAELTDWDPETDPTADDSSDDSNE